MTNALKLEICRPDKLHPVIGMMLDSLAATGNIAYTAEYLRDVLDPAHYFVYVGGSHIALHVACPGHREQGARIAVLVA